jgi:hypothetical protein
VGGARGEEAAPAGGGGEEKAEGGGGGGAAGHGSGDVDCWWQRQRAGAVLFLSKQPSASVSGVFLFFLEKRRGAFLLGPHPRRPNPTVLNQKGKRLELLLKVCVGVKLWENTYCTVEYIL